MHWFWLFPIHYKKNTKAFSSLYACNHSNRQKTLAFAVSSVIEGTCTSADGQPFLLHLTFWIVGNNWDKDRKPCFLFNNLSKCRVIQEIHLIITVFGGKFILHNFFGRKFWAASRLNIFYMCTKRRQRCQIRSRIWLFECHW